MRGCYVYRAFHFDNFGLLYQYRRRTRLIIFVIGAVVAVSATRAPSMSSGTSGRTMHGANYALAQQAVVVAADAESSAARQHTQLGPNLNR